VARCGTLIPKVPYEGVFCWNRVI